MYKFKSYNYYNNLAINYNLLYLDYLIKFNSFILFFNYNKITNTFLLYFRNEIKKVNAIPFTLNKYYINKIFSNYFKFLSSHILCIFMNNYTQFFHIIKLLRNIDFFYCYKKRFSNILNQHIIENEIIKYNNYKFLHYILFKILFNIIFILLYFILSIFNLLK